MKPHRLFFFVQIENNIFTDNRRFIFGNSNVDRITSLTPPLFIEVPVPSQDWFSGLFRQFDIFLFFYKILELFCSVVFFCFSVGFWNCSDSVVFFVLHFIAVFSAKYDMHLILKHTMNFYCQF
jgi:hypothetical protein